LDAGEGQRESQCPVSLFARGATKRLGVILYHPIESILAKVRYAFLKRMVLFVSFRAGEFNIIM
jgi:hypothetical protein